MYPYISQINHCQKSVRPIFHCGAKSFALGTFVSPYAKDSSFTLPNARNTNMLVSFALGDANFSCFTRRVVPDAFYLTRFTRRQSVEYRCIWPCGVGAGVGHVHFIFFV